MSHQFYSRFRNFVTNQIRQQKYFILPANFNNFKRDCESTWKQIHNIIRPNRINKRNIYRINKKDITYETKHDIANVLNSYIVNTGKHISESIQEPMITINILKLIMLIHYSLLLYPQQMLRKFPLLEIRQVISMHSELLF